MGEVRISSESGPANVGKKIVVDALKFVSPQCKTAAETGETDVATVPDSGEVSANTSGGIGVAVTVSVIAVIVVLSVLIVRHQRRTKRAEITGFGIRTDSMGTESTLSHASSDGFPRSAVVLSTG